MKLSEPGAELSALEKLPLFHGGVPGDVVPVDEFPRGDFTHFHSTAFKNKRKTK